ncbi:CesT family type III secretion system chaperone [Imhoffiella purpurea]|uniref:Putative type III secretion protein n=1 Tax=Imhoffiella purpurea TaxID=1249627 RepID=W9VF68_9GAMM|nr:CesT family type III secretion system chaperone [Imhoffiella purpurea]EXJ15646.1 putative type III secretion protein [Imhoffiella purpurea]
MIGSALDQLAQGLGFEDFRWADRDGRAVFAFERRGTLYLEAHGDGLLMSLSRPFDDRENGRERLCRALRLCHYRHDWPCAVQVGLGDGSNLLFLARLPAAEVTLPVLEQTLELLTRLHERTG